MKIGFYMRLSLADGDLGKDDKEESNSIENQRLLLQGFVESRKDITGDVTEYIDDGYTGTNFDRPDFKRMISDMESTADWRSGVALHPSQKRARTVMSRDCAAIATTAATRATKRRLISPPPCPRLEPKTSNGTAPAEG